MTETDISPEAVERLACILEGRGGFVKDSTITATLRALSAALTQSRAETAAAEARGMRKAAEIAERMEEALRQGYSITSANEVGKVYCSILAAIPQGYTTND